MLEQKLQMNLGVNDLIVLFGLNEVKMVWMVMV